MMPILETMSVSDQHPPDSYSHRDHPRMGWPRWVLVGACLVASLLASYLTLLKWTGRISDLAGCGGPEGCAEVLGGRWANWMRLPISLWALTVYIPLIVLAVRRLATARQTAIAFSGTAVLFFSAIWFVFVQAVIEGTFCPYCLAMHVCGTISFVILLVYTFRQDLPQRAGSWLVGGAAASLVMVALIVGQLYGPQPASFQITDSEDIQSTAPIPAQNIEGTEPGPNDAKAALGGDTPHTDSDHPDDVPIASKPSSVNETVVDHQSSAADLTIQHDNARVVQYFDGAIRWQLDQVPLRGSANARHILLKYFDYTCASCRRMHDDLEDIIALYPDDLAVILLPCPLNLACNPYVDEKTSNAHPDTCEYARLALAVFRANPEKFATFHDELFQLQGRLTPPSARLIAELLVGQAELESSLEDAWIDTILTHSVEVYGRLKKRNARMPKLLLGGRSVLHGVVVSSSFEDLLRDRFELRAP